ncbi:MULTISPECIES: DUF2264 domain-containing protein [Microbacterium]|uniref:DUF2264 domain-containing protein n=1 Tax=Microbacterium TaxID=33882 RepID=UPI00146E0008|nr:MULTISPECIES: DUF2264 domain-containing protein [Microbacterium]
MSPIPVPPAAPRDAAEWTRAEWVAYADRLLDGAARWASPSGARITLPGREGGYGRDIDGLEGFARSFLLAGFRIAGERGHGLDELIERYCRGIRAGVEPHAPDAWVRLDEHPQAKVEAASLALVLDMTRPWIWDRLDETTKSRVVDYLAPAVGDSTYPRNNWLWFRTVVQTFLRSVGGPWSPTDIAEDLALHDSFARADGWFSDGERRAYDHYVGWALHVYPILWSRMRGAAELGGGRTAGDIAALDRYLQDAVALIGADGSPLVQGRSLIYRFAAAAPFWVGAIAEVPSLTAGALRHAAGRVVGHFVRRGVPGADDVLTMGWHSEWRALAQSYSGPGSPYWAAKGLLGVALPADHPVWTAPAEPLPVETRDELRAVRAAGWIVSGTKADGIVRVVNHGTDHSTQGEMGEDSPLYARIGYSTATFPLLDHSAWQDPIDQSVSLIDGRDRASHRSGLTLREATVERPSDSSAVGVASSTWTAYWIDPQPSIRQHNAKLQGEPEPAGRLTVLSLVRGPWELRVCCVDELEPEIRMVRLRVGGWAVAGARPVSRVTDAAASVTGDTLTSTIRSVLGVAASAVTVRAHSPLAAVAAAPTLEYAVVAGSRVAAIIELAGAQRATAAESRLEFVGDDAVVTWPDGVRTCTALDHRLVDRRAGHPKDPARVRQSNSQRSIT